MSNKVLNVIRVYAGKVSGDNWFMFYCPNCETQLTSKTDCQHCKQVINWKSSNTLVK